MLTVFSQSRNERDALTYRKGIVATNNLDTLDANYLDDSDFSAIMRDVRALNF